MPKRIFVAPKSLSGVTCLFDAVEAPLDVLVRAGGVGCQTACEPTDSDFTDCGPRVLAIIQARMSSKRLEGKVLRQLAGRPLLWWVHYRLSRSTEISKIVISTSAVESDTPIQEFCSTNEIPIHRGSLDDVAGRLFDCAVAEGAGSFIRISGDSPLIDPALVDEAIALPNPEAYDLTTNTQFRSFPKGQSVEVIRTEALGEARRNMNSAADFEHVTRYFYEHPDQFTIRNFGCDEALGEIQLSVDTLEDLRVAEIILQQLGPDFSWRSATTVRSELSR